MSDYDAIIIGAGHNGLAAAITLAKAGWRVLVLERNAEPGGAVRTAEITLPGFHHDLFAANLSLFHGGPFFAEHQSELVAAGLEFLRAEKPFATVFPDGDAQVVTTDLAATLAEIARLSEADAMAWAEMVADFERAAPYLFPVFGAPLPSWTDLRVAIGGTAKLGRDWPAEMLQRILQPARAFLVGRFETEKVRALAGAWACHGDLAPDIAGGALLAWLESVGEQLNGAFLPKGGAARVIDAMVTMLESYSGTLRCLAPVVEVDVENGRARGVRLADGEVLACSRAVIANLAPTNLFGPMVREGLTEPFLRQVRRYRYGTGTLMVHLALSGLPDWRAGQHLQNVFMVHIAPTLDDMALAYQRAQAGLLPERPFVAVAQPTALDPTRAPSGQHVLWVMARMVPSQLRGDAAEEIEATSWEAAKDAFADRVQSIIEDYAPGLNGKVLARTVLSPDDLQDHNPNLVGGDLTCGAIQPMQNYVLRPFPGWSHYRTPIERLYLCGAATWPGSGTSAGPGLLLGRMLVG
jgi:phytoene dehydrogenase-like protein